MRVDLKLVLLVALFCIYIASFTSDVGVDAVDREAQLQAKVKEKGNKGSRKIARKGKRRRNKKFRDPTKIGKKSRYVNKGGAPKKQSGSDADGDPHVGNREAYLQKYFKGSLWGVRDKTKAPKRQWRKKKRKEKHPKKEKRGKMKAKEKAKRNKAKTASSVKTKKVKKKARKKKNKNRQKRYAINNEDRLWDYGIIPYKFSSVVTESMALTYTGVMDAISRRSCISFEEWDGTRQFFIDRDLNHFVHLNFIDEGGCWAYYGRYMYRTTEIAQNISCCYVGRTCMHEIFHSLSMEHEHTNPLREGWLRMNWPNLSPMGVDAFQVTDNLMLDRESWGFDIKSFVSYGAWTYSKNGMLSYQPLMPDFYPSGDSYWQPFKEVQLNYDCYGIKCDMANEPICENDGYPGYYENQCGCVCPPGLDPATNCATPRVTHSLTGWPSSSFGFLEPVEGCPTDFETGIVSNPMGGESSVSDSSHINVGIEGNMAEFGYCLKGETTGGMSEWPRGQYCIHSYGGSCPTGFLEGLMTFDDQATVGNPIVTTAPLPDGTFDNNTKLWFCCRSDGLSQLDIKLPNTEAFILYRYERSDCQQVEGMYVFPEYYTFVNAGETTATGDSVFAAIGDVPLHVVDRSLVYMYYCYYSPLNYNCGEVIHLDENKPSVDIMTPNYPFEYPNNIECNWLFVAPEGSEVMLNFNDFDVEGDDEDCYDFVTIKRYLPGIPGESYCGTQFKAAVQSLDKYLMVTFTTGGEIGYSGFHATARLLNVNDSCYSPDDFGRSYNGKHNYAEDFTSCLPWAEMTHCPNHPFQTSNAFENMDSNYCRNPQAKFDAPWCYTEKENCTIKYCDVCQERTVYDNFDDCDELIADYPNFCLDGDHHNFGCLETCVYHNHTQLDKMPGRALDVTCPAPPAISDASPLENVLTTYHVGDTVVYVCANGTSTKISRCQTDGTWTQIEYVCGGCGDEMVSDARGSCYLYVPELVRFVEAEHFCIENYWEVASAKTEEDFNFLISLRKKTGTESKKLWLNLFEEEPGVWTWGDGSLVQSGYTNWRSPYAASGPVEESNNWYTCATAAGDGQNGVWNHEACNSKWYLAHYICKTEESVATGCKDRKKSCSTSLIENPLFCSQFPAFANEICPFTCGLCGIDLAQLCVVNNELLGGLQLESLATLPMSLKPGEYFTTKCPTNHVCTENCNHFNRACDRNGQITGLSPVCKDADSVPTQLNNLERIPRGDTADGRRVYQGSGPHMNITRSGEITKWMAYCESDGPIYLMTFKYWDHQRFFQVRGVNQVQCKAGRRMTWSIPEGQRILVDPSMNIGFMDWEGGCIPTHFCDSATYPDLTKVYHVAVASNSSAQVNQYIWFSAGPTCIFFSLNAEISPIGYVAPVTPQLTTTTVAPDVTATEINLFTNLTVPTTTTTEASSTEAPTTESSTELTTESTSSSSGSSIPASTASASTSVISSSSSSTPGTPSTTETGSSTGSVVVVTSAEQTPTTLAPLKTTPKVSVDESFLDKFLKQKKKNKKWWKRRKNKKRQKKKKKRLRKQK